MPALIFQQADNEPHKCLLEQPVTFIGRNPECHVVIDDSSVSSCHAEVTIDGDTVQLRDLDSSNGTTVNGESIAEAQLRDGDEIEFGSVKCRFENAVIEQAIEIPSPPIPPEATTRVSMNSSVSTPRKTPTVSTPRKNRRTPTLVLLFVTLCVFGAVAWRSFGKSPFAQPTEGEAKPYLKFSNADGQFEITILRVLLGESCVSGNVFSEGSLRDERSKGRTLVYFEVSVKNSTKKPKLIHSSDFTLNDTDGFTYPNNSPENRLFVDVVPGNKGRGGIGFSIPKGSVPKTLIYKTGLEYVSSGKADFAFGNLSSISLFASGRGQGDETGSIKVGLSETPDSAPSKNGKPGGIFESGKRCLNCFGQGTIRTPTGYTVPCRECGGKGYIGPSAPGPQSFEKQ